MLAESWEGKRLNAPNDLAVSRSGHVYFTDPAFGESSDRRELDFYGVYHIPPKGPMKLVARPAGRPNGIALSPNGRVLYVGNADEHNIRAYDLDRDGDTSNERVLVAGIADVPGGIAVDEKGDLYVAAGSNPDIHPRGTAARHHRDGAPRFGLRLRRRGWEDAAGYGGRRALARAAGSPGRQLMRGQSRAADSRRYPRGRSSAWAGFCCGAIAS